MGQDSNKTKQVALHVHPNFVAYGLEQILHAMDLRHLDVVALMHYNEELFDEVCRLAERLDKSMYPFVEQDGPVIRIEKKDAPDRPFYLVEGIEIGTQDSFHLLAIGSDHILPGLPIRRTLDSMLSQNSLVIFDHAFAYVDNFRKRISAPKQREVTQLCRDYSERIALEWNGYCIPWMRKMLLGGDVNTDALLLSEALARDGYKVPVVPTDDIHARSVHALRALGTARIKVEIDDTSGNRIVSSLAKNILADRFEKTFKYVDALHFALYFGIPYLHDLLVRSVPAVERIKFTQTYQRFLGKLPGPT